MRSGLRSNRLVCENAFHRSLRVVEVAADADGMDVLIRRRRHLEALDFRRARRRIEDDDFGAVDARKALHRGTSRVTARRGQDEDTLAIGRMLHEHRQHRERDILERTCLAVEELENLQSVLLDERNRIPLREPRTQPVRRRRSHLCWQIAEEGVHHQLLGFAQSRNLLKPLNLLNLRRHVQPAIRRQPLKHSFGARRLKPFSRTDVFHLYFFQSNFRLQFHLRPA